VKLKREPATTRNGQTYFVTSETGERRSFFKYERWSKLFLETLFGYRAEGSFLLHEFVLMVDHSTSYAFGEPEKSSAIDQGRFF